MKTILRALVLSALIPVVAFAQQTPSAMSTAPAPLHLSIADAVSRGLEHNLSVILDEQRVRESGSARLAALSELVPHVNMNLRESTQLVSLAAFGFTGFGDFPTLIGPFNVFDARIGVSTPVIDVAAWRRLKAASLNQDAASSDYQHTRETVVLAIGNLYLLALADDARLSSADAQVTTAEALARTAGDQHANGLVPKIDLTRQQVQLQAAKAQHIAAANMLANRKLQLGRAIGLPEGQAFDLTTPSMFIAIPAPTLDAAVTTATEHRPDVASAKARVEAAMSMRSAAAAGYLPSLHVDGDVGAIGNTVGSMLKTYSVSANVHIPIFNGGKTQADVAHANAELKQRQAELADLENGVRYDVKSALLTLQSAEASVEVAKSGSELAKDQLTQAQDRFTAGVASTIELVQAEEAVAKASEQYISSLYAHTIAKAGLARAMGVVEAQFVKLVGGQQ